MYPVPVHPGAVDHDESDIFRRAGVHNRGIGIRLIGGIPEAAEIEKRQVCFLPGFQTSGFTVAAESHCPAPRRKLEDGTGSHRRRAVQRLLYEGRKAHFLKHVERVVARRSVGTERNRDPPREELGNPRDS